MRGNTINGRNPHHWEYWIDNIGTRANTPIKMPEKYVKEMMCDWIAASIVYSGKKINWDHYFEDVKKYYDKVRPERIFHPETEKLIDMYLHYVDTYGINDFCRWSKHVGYFYMSVKFPDKRSMYHKSYKEE